MRLFGFNFEREPAVQSLGTLTKAAQGLQSVWSSRSWWGYGGPILESFTGAWQKNIVVDSQTSILAFSAVFACVTGIASDVAKLRIKLDRDVDGIWEEITQNQPWLPVLRKPNHYQTRIEFIEQWIVSKLLHGNAYILKQRDDKRGIVTAMYVLDPCRVKVLVADNGDVYYELQQDHLSELEENDTVPASAIIHDRMVCLWHPLVGVSPLYACSKSATMGNRIQDNSVSGFGNMSRPGGILTAPGRITNETAGRLKAEFEANFSGPNVGRLAVLGDGLKFEPMIMTAEVMQLIDQLKWTVDDVARAFHYPIWKLGGPLPPYSSGPEALTMMYYTDCLQTLIEKLEICLDEGLELPSGMGTELDLDNLMRMDTGALYDSNNKGVSGGWLAPNEARFKANYAKAIGGDSPLIQQQNYSLQALAKRDAQEDPFASKQPALPPAPEKPALPPPPKELDLEDLEFFEAEVQKEVCFK